MNLNEQGGAAFPHSVYAYSGQKDDINFKGMSLRDWFAGQALAGIVSDENWHNLEAIFVARAAYLLADAMLEARQ